MGPPRRIAQNLRVSKKLGGVGQLARRMQRLLGMETAAQSPEQSEAAHPHPLHVSHSCLRTEGVAAVLTVNSGPMLRLAGPGIGTPACWSEEALLLGAVEAGVRADFVRRAQRVGLDVDFYESTAQARWTEDETGPCLLDVTVEPRIGVKRAADAPTVPDLLAQVASASLVARALRTPLTIRPTVEVWIARTSSRGDVARKPR